MGVFDSDNSSRKKITLSERDWRAFTEALEEDREPSERVKEAARYNEWRAEARTTDDGGAADLNSAQ